MTHAAILSRKYKRIIMNDINDYPKFFLECIAGKHTLEIHKEWISREMFYALKDTDNYVKYCWSFGNNGKDYLYGRDMEEYKRALHYLIVLRDAEPMLRAVKGLFDADALHEICGIEDINKRSRAYKRVLNELYRAGAVQKRHNHFYNIERCQNISDVETLERLQTFERLQSDYRDVEIPKGAVIYCDIPYKGTSCGSYEGFNHDNFYEWAAKQENIFVSEYTMPNSWNRVKTFTKQVNSTNKGSYSMSIEGLFTNDPDFYCEEQLTFLIG